MHKPPGILTYKGGIQQQKQFIESVWNVWKAETLHHEYGKKTTALSGHARSISYADQCGSIKTMWLNKVHCQSLQINKEIL